VQQQKNDKTTCLLLALTTIFWGSLYTASKVLLDVIQPFTLLCLRWIDRFEHRFLMPSFDGFARVCQRIMVPMAANPRRSAT